MNHFDIGILAVVLISAALGLWRGMTREVTAVITWVVAVLATVFFGHAVAALFTVIDLPPAREFLGHVSVFVGVMLLGSVLQWLLVKGVKSSGLSGMDRALGLGFGLLRAALLVSLLTLGLGFTPAAQSTAWHEAKLSGLAETGARGLRALMPQAAAEWIRFSDSVAQATEQGA